MIREEETLQMPTSHDGGVGPRGPSRHTPTLFPLPPCASTLLSASGLYAMQSMERGAGLHGKGGGAGGRRATAGGVSTCFMSCGHVGPGRTIFSSFFSSQSRLLHLRQRPTHSLPSELHLERSGLSPDSAPRA